MVRRAPGGVRGAPGGLSLASKLSRSGSRNGGAVSHQSSCREVRKRGRCYARARSKRGGRRFAESPVDQIAVKNLVTVSAEVEQVLVLTTEQTTARNKLA